MSATNHSKKNIKTLFHSICIYMLRKNIVANVQEVKHVTLEFTVSPFNNIVTNTT